MIRNLKALGLALVTVLAMSAMVASAASADPIFTATSGAKITAADTGRVQLKVTGQTITCSTAHYQGTAPGASFTKISISAEYGHCTTGLGTTVTIKGFGKHGEEKPCNFVLYAAGQADLECPPGQEVIVDAATCDIHIPAQKGLGTLAYANNGTHVDISLNVKEITANHTDGFLCPMTGSGHASSAELVTPEKEPLTVIPSTGTLAWDESASSFTATSGAKITAADTGRVQLKVTGQTITCSTAHYQGTAPGASFTKISISAEYGHCTTGLGTTVTIKGFGKHGEEKPCNFVLYAAGQADLECPPGQEVIVDAATCDIHIPAQKGLGTLAYANNGTHVDISLNVKEITANHTDGFLCPMTGSGHASSAELVTPEKEPLTVIPSTGTLAWDESASSFTATSGAKITAADTGRVQLKVTGQTITCSTAHYQGTAPGASFTKISISAEYGHCTTGLGTTVTIKGFGKHGEEKPCNFVLYAAGQADLECPPGQEVIVDAATCDIHIPAQKGLGTLAYANNGTHVDISLNVKEITANHTDGFLCPMTGSGHASSAELVTPEKEPLTVIPSTGTISFDE